MAARREVEKRQVQHGLAMPNCLQAIPAQQNQKYTNRDSNKNDTGNGTYTIGYSCFAPGNGKPCQAQPCAEQADGHMLQAGGDGIIAGGCGTGRACFLCRWPLCRGFDGAAFLRNGLFCRRFFAPGFFLTCCDRLRRNGRIGRVGGYCHAAQSIDGV
mgnify:CR=1 FL=1